jgi:pseudouridylate synthase
MTGLVDLSTLVREAVQDGRAVVALETSVLAQGLPSPHNLSALDAMESAIRSSGAEPAWIWVEHGHVRVGGSPDEVAALAGRTDAVKVARRDLPMAVAGGLVGATTVSATVWAARAAGIEVSCTGGIGGVHPGTGDVSADLVELARTPGALVCAGPKSIVDPRATLERLEELGVGVLGYRCERLPFFLTGETDLELEHHVDTPEDAAAVIRAARATGVASTLVICTPIPPEHALADDEVLEAVAECQARSHRLGIRGKDVTPFLLRCMAEVTGGRSLAANLSLLEANALVAGEVAVSLAER